MMRSSDAKASCSPRALKFKKRTRIKWVREEDAALVQFVALHRDLQPTDLQWPAMNPDDQYWKLAAAYIKEISGTKHLRKGEFSSSLDNAYFHFL